MNVNKSDNREETDQFLETQNLPKLNHVEGENLNRPITSKETESAIKNFPIGVPIVAQWVKSLT